MPLPAVLQHSYKTTALQIKYKKSSLLYMLVKIWICAIGFASLLSSDDVLIFIVPLIMLAIAKPNPLLRQLLQDLEANGGCFEANFESITSHNTGCYGEKGSAVKRNYVITVDNLKRRYTAQQYKDIVEENNVISCAQTVNDAMEELKENMAKPQYRTPNLRRKNRKSTS